MYGGTFLTGDVRQSGMGLSPRVRGNRGNGIAAAVKPRSIPACTGEPLIAAGSNPAVPVYPRVYGGTMFIEYESS